MRLLSICGALAAGEFAASAIPEFAEIWPVAIVAMTLVVLFGYGLGLAGWRLLAVFLLGAGLFLGASVENERHLRECPWMRGRRVRQVAAGKVISGRQASIKASLARRMTFGLEDEPEILALNRAILLGERSRLPADVKRVFVESGTMHVFAISGLHVMMIARVLTVFLAVLFIPRRFIGMAALPLLWGYVWLIGAPPSAVRAASMASIQFLAPLFWRRPDSLTAWSLTFLGVHVFRPLMIVDVGCALSFVVMLAVVWTGEQLGDMRDWRKFILVTCAAWAVGVPISVHTFGRITPGGILANLPLLATAGWMVGFGAVGALAGFVSQGLAAYLNNLSALLTRAMVLAAETVSRLPGANFEISRWGVPGCMAWYAVLALVLLGLWKWRSGRILG